jgi:hypothetical protein
MEDDEICYICSEKIKDVSNLEILKCNHKFCYECIYNWYETIINKINYGFNNYQIRNECPVCRKDGGYLTLTNKEDYVQHIHGKLKKHQLDTILCSAPLLDGESSCKRAGVPKYGFYCSLHKNFEIVNPKKLSKKEKEKVLKSKEDILKYKIKSNNCSALSKSGNKCKKYARKGYKTCFIHKNYFEQLQKCNAKTAKGTLCKNKGNSEYGGFCGIHKNNCIVYPEKLMASLLQNL